MKVTILGCSGGYPAANGACSGYLVSEGERTLLLDCGSGVLGRLLALTDPLSLDGIIITHWHYDHASDLLPLQYCLQSKKSRLHVYGPEENAPLRTLCECPEFILHSLRDVKRIGAFQVEAFPTKHPMPSFAVKVMVNGSTLVYTGDAAEMESLKSFCKEADVLLCDAAFSKVQWTSTSPHMNAEMAASLALSTDHVELVLTHFPPGQDIHALLKEARAVYPDSIAAHPGLQINI